MNFKWILWNSHKYILKTVSRECCFIWREDICEWRCPETTALGITEQTDRCKAYQDWTTLRGRFGADIYSLPATVGNASPLGHTYFQHIHHSAHLQGSNSATRVDWVRAWQNIQKLNMRLQEFWVQTLCLNCFFLITLSTPIKHQNATSAWSQQPE